MHSSFGAHTPRYYVEKEAEQLKRGERGHCHSDASTERALQTDRTLSSHRNGDPPPLPPIQNEPERQTILIFERPQPQVRRLLTRSRHIGLDRT